MSSDVKASPVQELVGRDDMPRVVAAAIIGDDGKVYSLPPPARHHDVGHHMIEQGHKAPYPGGDKQGFLLSDGTFARRARAKMFAELNGQLLSRAGKMRELFSEDVW